MKIRKHSPIHIPFCLLAVVFLMASAKPVLGGKANQTIDQQVVWSMESLGIPELTEGLAGCYFGTQGNFLILAGGSHFPASKPWEGGVKEFSDIVIVLERQPSGELNLVNKAVSLPRKLAEGAYVSTPGGLLCIGGQGPEGLSDLVFRLSFENGQIFIRDYPLLPYPLKNGSAAIIGTKVYLAGGEGAGGPTDQFLTLDLNLPDEGWKVLENLPLKVSGATLAAQGDGEEISLFLFGGRAREKDQLQTVFFSSVFQFKPSTGKWSQKKDIANDPLFSQPLSMAVALPLGATHILLAGGDTGETFNLVEQAINEMAEGVMGAHHERDSLWQNHPGFYDQLLVYNTITDTWFEAGKWEGEPVAVSSITALNGAVYVFGGEIKPAIRSPWLYELNFEMKTSFGWLNYLVLIFYFGGMLVLGFFFLKKEGDTNDFFKAGGRIPWWAAGISIFATTLSAITFIAIPAKTYATDWRMLVFNLTIVLIAPVVIRFFLPFFRRFNFDTAYQYLEFRFNRWVRWLASLLFIFFMISRIAIVLFLPSLALNAVTGFSIYYSIIIMGVVTVIYCTSGGIEAVVWGDVIQGFILITGAVLAFIFMMTGTEGGLGSFWNAALENQKFHAFDFCLNFSQPVFWVVLLGGLANSLITYTSDQSVVQRYMTTKDEKATARSIWLNGFLSIPVSLLFFLLGTGLYAFYTSNPGDLNVVSKNIDSVFPQFIVSEMPQGLAGLLIAAIFAAAMSTLSSNINSAAAVVTSDFYQTIGSPKETSSSMRVARWSGLTVGSLGIVMALILATWNIASLWDQFNTFLGLLTSGLGALFVMGIFFPRIGGIAALTGVGGGLAALLWIKNYSTLSFLLFGLAGLVASISIALLFSLIFINKKNLGAFSWKSRIRRKN